MELLQKFKLNLLPITVNKAHATDNRKARKRKNYADVVKVTKRNHWSQKAIAVTLMKRMVRIKLILKK